MNTETRRASPTGEVRPESKLRSYARLAKLDVYDYYLSIFVAASAVVLPLGALDARTVLTLLGFLIGEVLVTVALVAFDDLTGFRDGSDIKNYGPDNPLRKKLRKPLVAGTLEPREAERFGWIAALLGAAVWAGTLAIAPASPVWTVAVTGVLYVLALQYSYGLKLSYRGLQEIFLVWLGLSMVIAPYGLVSGQFSWFVFVQGLLFGFGPLMFGVYSNSNDVEGDRLVNRPTVAALVSERGNTIFIGALSFAEFAIGALASALGAAPWWFVLLMLPATALRARQYYLGFRVGDIMRARKLGFKVHRVSVGLLIVANLLIALGGPA
ncbi:UbiA family prenyltransferase [Saccharopolyspora hattusasensis]|uniref:UbiA family prenyltransferase n=1 Tax=Saccharopolyspora hattusasensis TaxID=1128679 RepID=UPI003D9607A2